MLEIVLKSLVFVFVLVDGIFLGVLLHELGHALLAVITTKQYVQLNVGAESPSVGGRFGRLEVSLSYRQFYYGYTKYNRDKEPKGKQALIALGGPLASLVATLASAWWLSTLEMWSYLWLIALALFVANFRILIVAIWPIEYRGGPQGEKWLSDSLDFWRTLRGK